MKQLKNFVTPLHQKTKRNYIERMMDDKVNCTLIAKKYDILILSDEIYSELSFEKNFKSIANYYPEKTIISTGLSKWCGAGGWRLGYFIIPDNLSNITNQLKVLASETFSSVSAPIQYAAIAAHENNHDEYINKSKNILKAVGNYVYEKLKSNEVLINKPQGIESFGVIRKLKFRYSFKKIGFAGTLDPLASGLLLVGINKATKKIPNIHQEKKSYEVEIRFGASTNTLDSEGRFFKMKSSSHNINERVLHLKKFIGTYQQKIPDFSAHKLNGKNFYELARDNKVIEHRYKKVSVQSLKVLSSNNSKMRVELNCRSGFYVRAFAEEFANSLGDIAYASMIKRMKIGTFDINQAIPCFHYFLG